MSLPITEARAGAGLASAHRSYRHRLAPRGRFAIQLERARQRAQAAPQTPTAEAKAPTAHTHARFRRLRSAAPIQTTAPMNPTSAPAAKPKAIEPAVIEPTPATAPSAEPAAAPAEKKFESSWGEAAIRAVRTFFRHPIKLGQHEKGSALARIMGGIAKNLDMPQAELDALVDEAVRAVHIASQD